MKTIKLLAILFISTLVFTGCEDDHDDHGHSDEEVITTVIYTLTDGTNTFTLQWEDLDGDTGNAPIITPAGGITLASNNTYTGIVQLLNKTESPAEDVTVEVKAESNEHEFFYSNNAGLTITKTDKDSNNNELGLETSVVANVMGSGSLTIILKHEPKKPNTGVVDAGGSTDVQVTFPITVN